MQFKKLPIDQALDYKNPTQIARVVTELWALTHIRCLECGGELQEKQASTPVVDFGCNECDAEYQLKSQKKPFRSTILGAGFKPTLNAINAAMFPHVMLLQYDADIWEVVALDAIHNKAITERVVKARKPLEPTARRAGWQGCTFDLNRIPSGSRISLNLENSALSDGLDQWRQFSNLSSDVEGAWESDVLGLIDGLAPQFNLQELYQFEHELSRLHPENHNIRPKIRQKLQVLRDHGFIRFLGKGCYLRV